MLSSHAGTAKFALFLVAALSVSSYTYSEGSLPPHYNSNILVENGISPEILDMPLRFISQGVKARMDVNITITDSASGEQLSTQDFEFIVDPFGPAGADSYFLYPKGSEFIYKKRRAKHWLEDYMGMHFVSPDATHLYDENSITLLKDDPKHTIIGFTYNKSLLYAETSDFRFSNGELHIIDGKPAFIELVNDRPYKSAGFSVQSSIMRMYLSRVADNRGYLTNKLVTIESMKDGTRHETTALVTSYTDISGNPVELKDGPLPISQFADTEMESIRVKVERTLPFFGKEVRKMGYRLPKPIGVQIFAHSQTEDMEFTDFNLNGENLNDFIDPNGSSTENRTDIVAARTDIWILPFMSINAILGKAQTTSDIKLKGGAIGLPNPDDPIFGDPIIPPGQTIELPNQKTDTNVAGIGTTLGIGYGNVFASLDYMYVKSITAGVDVELDAHVYTPTVGYIINRIGLRVVVGGQYQDYETTIKGTLPGLGDFEVGQKLDKWTYLVGFQKEFLRNWEASLMLASGSSRKSATFVAGYRF